jgi:hypothetical protein
MTTTKQPAVVFGRFRTDAVGGRILRLLSDGKPRTINEIARVAKPKSKDNITAAGGWYSLLKRYGRESRQFDLYKTDGGKLVLTVRRERKRKAA